MCIINECITVYLNLSIHEFIFYSIHLQFALSYFAASGCWQWENITSGCYQILQKMLASLSRLCHYTNMITSQKILRMERRKRRRRIRKSQRLKVLIIYSTETEWPSHGNIFWKLMLNWGTSRHFVEPAPLLLNPVSRGCLFWLGLIISLI